MDCVAYPTSRRRTEGSRGLDYRLRRRRSINKAIDVQTDKQTKRQRDRQSGIRVYTNLNIQAKRRTELLFRLEVDKDPNGQAVIQTDRFSGQTATVHS